jgi:hypothetical protein
MYRMTYKLNMLSQFHPKCVFQRFRKGIFLEIQKRNFSLSLNFFQLTEKVEIEREQPPLKLDLRKIFDDENANSAEDICGYLVRPVACTINM